MGDFYLKTLEKNCKPPKLHELPALGLVKVFNCSRESWSSSRGCGFLRAEEAAETGQGFEVEGIVQKGTPVVHVEIFHESRGWAVCMLNKIYHIAPATWLEWNRDTNRGPALLGSVGFLTLLE